MTNDTQRCAECNCEKGGADCNWIKPGPLAVDDYLDAKGYEPHPPGYRNGLVWFND